MLCPALVPVCRLLPGSRAQFPHLCITANDAELCPGPQGMHFLAAAQLDRRDRAETKQIHHTMHKQEPVPKRCCPSSIGGDKSNKEHKTAPEGDFIRKGSLKNQQPFPLEPWGSVLGRDLWPQVRGEQDGMEAPLQVTTTRASRL